MEICDIRIEIDEGKREFLANECEGIVELGVEC
jgi:hypothetical protein